MIFANGPNKKATWIKGIFILVLGPPAFLQVHYTPTTTNPVRWIEWKWYYSSIYGKQMQRQSYVGIGTCPFGFVKVKLTGIGHQKSYPNQPTKSRSLYCFDRWLLADCPPPPQKKRKEKTLLSSMISFISINYQIGTPEEFYPYCLEDNLLPKI
jgi:hypothetical protein